MILNTIHNDNCLTGLSKLRDESVHCCVTSPPYYGLRDYGCAGQLGLEDTPELYCEAMVRVFEEVRRVLRKDGTLWLNLGDSYAGNGGQYGSVNSTLSGRQAGSIEYGMAKRFKKTGSNIKSKDLFGIPWMIAFAFRSAGWYLRSDIIWAKKNCMPESVTDRPTRSHEYIFLLSKSAKYYYDYEAIKEPALYDIDGTGTAARKARQKTDNKSMPTNLQSGIRPASDKQRGLSRRHNGFNDRRDKMSHEEQCTGLRNKRDVWTISPAQFPEAHFATFPEDLIVPCIKAGCPVGGIVLDPFMGAGTTALVARKLNRNFIGYELNADYIKIAETRLKNELGMFL